MMSEAIFTMHSGVRIEFVEQTEKWCYEINGTERSTASLANAKKAIDSPPRNEKKVYVPTSAILRSYRGYNEVIVTSMAEEGKQFWVRHRDGSRSKESVSQLFVKGTANLLTMQAVRGLKEEIRLLEQRIREKKNELTPFVGLDEVRNE